MQAKITDAAAKLASRTRYCRTQGRKRQSWPVISLPVERALPDYLAAGKRFADALEKLHSTMKRAQWSALSATPRRRSKSATVFCARGAARHGRGSRSARCVAPIPAAQPVTTSVPIAGAVAADANDLHDEICKFRDHDGRIRFAFIANTADETIPLVTMHQFSGR
ncbi:hypothetical protein [Bradyrhizobium diazoefficiens]|uniref:hypothetical protein n=1 Tax=Bradyrhizobium diazoefficiens TaxID=1355477 RepID=UPI00235036E8|nr:hypothetical protein [Bradyrhizobium diazoefficiens]MDC8016277.1 hypothetical protein [Bradyrhizobium diazoefficiens]